MDQSTQQPAKSPQQIIAELRARVTSGGKPLTRDEVRDALFALRQNRMSAAEGGASKRKSATPTRSTAELLANLKNTVVGGNQQ